jgi:hypothetical protein
MDTRKDCLDTIESKLYMIQQIRIKHGDTRPWAREVLRNNSREMA